MRAETGTLRSVPPPQTPETRWLRSLWPLREPMCPDSSSTFRMVGDEVALTAANPKLDVKVSLHPAFQCMVIGY
jgi:hypothetical protein